MMVILQQFLFGQTDQTCSYDELIKAISNLPEDNRQAIVLHYINKITRKDIAKQLGWSVSKVNAKITRGISLLKRDLNPAAFARAKQLGEDL